jgi:16S rRNA processing protein RimM
MQLDDCYFLGYIVKPIGLTGKFQVKLDVSEPLEYTELESVFVEINKQLIPFFIESIELQPNSKAHVTFQDIDSPDLARDLGGKQLFLPLDILPELEGNHFYFHEIEGYQCIDNSFGKLGNVLKVQEAPAQDLLVVEHKGNEVLIPLLDNTVQSLNRTTREIIISTPEGLIDMYIS